MTYAYDSELENSNPPEGAGQYFLATIDPSDGSEIVVAWFELLDLGESTPASTTEAVTIGDFTGELVTYRYDPDDEFVFLELRFQLPDGTNAAISSEQVSVEQLVALALTARRATPDEVQAMNDDFQTRLAEAEAEQPTTTMTFPAPDTTGGLASTSSPSTTSIVSTTIVTIPTSTVTTGPPDTPLSEPPVTSTTTTN